MTHDQERDAVRASLLGAQHDVYPRRRTAAEKLVDNDANGLRQGVDLVAAAREAREQQNRDRREAP